MRTLRKMILSRDERRLLVEHGEELLELEERYGTQRAALEARPALAPTAKALQLARAQVAAEAMGLELRGDGRPLPADIVAELQIVFSRLVAESDVDPLAGIATPSSLARFLDEHVVDEDVQ
jgi:hypothetical protein